MTASGSRMMRLAALVIGSTALIAAVAVFVGFRMTPGAKSRPAAIMPKGIDMALGSIDHTATQDGRKHWQLKAKNGQLERASNLLLLKQVHLVIFMENGQEMTISADEGTLDTASNDIELIGNVVLISQDNTLSTAKLGYTHQRRVMTTAFPVHLTNGDSWLGADAMVYDLKDSRAEFSGKVEARMGQRFVF